MDTVSVEKNGSQEGPGFLDAAMESGAKKAGEHFVDRALNGLVDFAKTKYGAAQVVLGTAFQRYLENATQRYNQVRTLATGTEPRTIIGQGNLYVNIGIRHGEKEIDTSTVDPMLRISKNLLILGTGGVGKSMLMRYLFLNTANRGEYVPVLLELRRISAQVPGQVSILELIYTCLKDYDIQLPRELFEYSLRSGKYLFLLDGFDEVKESLSAETAAQIQAFCAKYPKNPCIITSRPRQDAAPLETFTIVESMPLNKEQAVYLASKIWKEDEKTREFCRQLDETLYEMHSDFAENPLLLSMMFLTFMRNSSIPDHLADFYQKAYEALYSAHDSNDKGFYRRDFRCKALNESGFKMLFAYFCFHTYYKEVYEFSRTEILSYIEKGIAKLNLKGILAADYLEDLRNAVCIIVKDGNIYRFAHRSFQAYFAAYYTSSALTDEQQKKLFADSLDNADIFWDKVDYYELLFQIEPERVGANALEEELRSIQKDLIANLNPDRWLLKLLFTAIKITKKGDATENLVYSIASKDGNYYRYNVVTLFRYFLMKRTPLSNRHLVMDRISRHVSNIKDEKDMVRDSAGNLRCEISFRTIDESSKITDEEKEDLYAAIEKVARIAELRDAIINWLSMLDARRESLAKPSFIDDL